MEIKIKGKRGITLITLVITIILLLILAAVSVTMLTGESGFFGKARLARENTEKAEYKEIIKMAQAEDNITTDRLRGKETKLNEIAEILNKDKKLGEGTGTQITKEYQDKENPRLVVKTKENWVYIVTVDGIKELGKVDGDIPLDIDVKNGDIKYIYEPNYWTNSDVEVSLSIAKEEYKEFKIQYSYDLKTWKDYTEKIVIENNKAIYSRITTGTSVSETYATGNVINIDKKEAEISTAMNSSNVTTKGFTVNVGVTDENSGLGKIVWYYKKSDATSYTSEEVIYKDLHSVQAGKTTAVTKSKTYDNLTSGTYNVYAEIYDVAGNITDANSSDKSLEITLGTVTGLTTANTTFTASPTGWTNGKVTMTASTNVSGYTIQTTKTPTVESSWKSTASQEFTENGKIYARLWDGTNAGGYSTGNVTNIDTLAPKGFTPTATSTTKSITVTANTTDAEATNTSASSGIAGYRFKLDSGSWTEYQTSGTYKWDNLAQTTNHTITVEAKDNAGNTKQGTASKGTGTVAGLTDANTTFTASPTGWTNGKVTMTASTNVSGYTIQTSKDAQTWSSTASQEFTENGKIYARLWDGTNAGGYSTGNVTNIDKKEAEISTAINSSNVTTKGFTVNVGVKDENSGLGKIVWYYKKSDATSYTSEEVIYKELHSVQTGETTAVTKSKTYDNLISGTYNVYAEIYDVAGNITNANSSDKPLKIKLGAVETATGGSFSPTDWTNGDVTVALPQKDGFTTRYTIDETVPTTSSTAYLNPFAVSSNCTITYIYTDGTNIGGVGTLNVTNIDKTPPGEVTVTYNGGANSCSWKNNYNLTLSASDGQSGIAYYEIDWDGDGGYNSTTNSNFIPWDGYHSCGTKFRAVDNAGNRGAWTGAHHIHMDTTAPTIGNISSAFTIVSGNTGYITVSNVTDTGGSGIAGYYVNTVGQWVSSSSSSFSQAVTTAGTYYIYAKDNAGNVSAAKSCTVYVASAVARIGGTYFTSLGNAVNAVAANNVQTEIVLLADTNESVTISAGKNIALNLNGKTLSYTGTPLTNNGTVSIYGGTISSNGNASDGGDTRWALLNNGTAHFLNGTIKSYGGYAARNYGTLNMSGGTFSLTGGTTHTCVFNQGTFNMSAGTISSDQYGLVTDGDGVSNATGGSITCNSNDVAVLVRSNGYARFIGSTITQNGVGYCLMNGGLNGRLILIHCGYQESKVSGNVACINGVGGTNDAYNLRLYGSEVMNNETKVAVWSIDGGQDDLIWYDASRKTSSWKDFVIYYSRHGGVNAARSHHAYIFPSTGAQFVCGFDY